MTAGKELGLTGDELKVFLQEQQNIAREQRLIERDTEKERRETEKERRETEKERRETEIQLEKEKRETEIRLEELRMDRDKIKLQEERVSLDKHKSDVKLSGGLDVMRLPTFNATHDKFDTYITRFENIAKMQNWQKKDWPLQLSLVLTGEPLETFYLLTEEEQQDYDVIKESLLRKYSLTEDEFRRRFYEMEPGDDEAIQQFAARLERTFMKWIESSKIKKDFNSLRDLIVREGLYNRCSSDLTAYLREKELSELPEVIKFAQRYIDAHMCTTSWRRCPSSKRIQKQQNEQCGANPTAIENTACAICKRTGHDTESCWFKGKDTGMKKKCFNCGSTEHLIRDCKADKNAIGMSSVRGNPEALDLHDRYAHLPAEELGKILNVPISEGIVNGHKVRVMRDTGFASAAVKSKYVRSEDYIDEYENVYLLDSTKRKFQKAWANIESRYFTGKMKMLVVDSLVVDCVIGNVEDEAISKRMDDQLDDVAATVVTRAQTQARKKGQLPLMVEESELVNKETFKRLQIEDKTLQKYWDQAGGEEIPQKYGTVRYEVKKDLLYRLFTPESGGKVVKQLIVPETVREKVISVAHDSMLSGHCGIKRTKERVISNFYWKDMDADVRRFCQSCSVCQKTLPKGRQGKAPLQKMPLIAEPFRRIAVDLIGPITPCSERGHKYILTVVDYATRYPEAEVLKTIDTISVAEGLISIFCRIGFPEEMLTDRGTQFVSDLMEEINRLLSLKHLKTTAWHPQCNGLVERFNGTLKTILKKLCAECPEQWDRYLPSVLFAYRTSIQESSGFSPFELVFGRKIRGPMELLRAFWGGTEDEEVKNTYKYVVDLKQRLQETCNIAQQELLKAQEMNKKYYDRSARPKTIEVGKRVLLLLPTKANKLLLQWRGPYEVVEKISPVNYAIQVGRKRKTYHVNMLKQFNERQEMPEETSDDKYIRENERGEDVEDERVTSNMEHGEVASNDDNEVIIGNTVVLKDGEADDPEMIDVCPLSSNESWQAVNINPQLTEKQTNEIKQLLQEESDVLTTLPGQTELEQHTITLTTEEPIRAKLYPIPYTQREVIRKEVEEMIKMKVIRPSKSPYAAPPVLVKKSDGTIRFCVNYKKLNQMTVFDGEPMPCPDDVYLELRGKKYRTKMDLTKGYWQIGVHPNSIEKTAFITPDGVYEFVRMPFGLKNSAATFNRVMRRVFNDMTCVGCFVDDIIVYTDSWEEHLQVLHEVFRRLRAAGLTVKPSKCTVGVTEVEFVGHMVGFETIQPRQSKIQEVLNVGAPKTRRQVKSFLAMAGYYAKFMKNFSDITFPLTELTKGRPGKFQWGEREQSSFESVKSHLARDPILRIVDFKKTMYVQTDASDVGLGAALLQKHDGLLHPVRYMSRKLKPAEKNYSTVEREGLAVIWAIEKLRVFLYGREFILLVDHKPLTYIHNNRFMNHRVMRWSLFLQDWSYTIESIKGVDNLLADCLSRM